MGVLPADRFAVTSSRTPRGREGRGAPGRGCLGSWDGRLRPSSQDPGSPVPHGLRSPSTPSSHRQLEPESPAASLGDKGAEGPPPDPLPALAPICAGRESTGLSAASASVVGLGTEGSGTVDGTQGGSHQRLSPAAVRAPRRLPVSECLAVRDPLTSPCSPVEEVLAAHLASEKTEAWKGPKAPLRAETAIHISLAPKRKVLSV